MTEDVTRFPLLNRAKEIVAHALIDTADAETVLARNWCLDSSTGYVSSKQGVVNVRLHRFLLGLERGNPLQGDHINRNRLDNRRSNLRIVTAGENAQNNSGKRGSTSLHRGVSWDARVGRWSVFTHIDGKGFYLGRFVDELEAAEVARAWRLANMPGAVD